MSFSVSPSHARPQLHAGKPHLFRELFTRNKRELLDYLTRRVGGTAAPDLLQETFIRFLLHEQAETVADPSPFLQKIAVNLARDFARRRKTEAKYLDFGDPPENIPSADALPDARLEAAEQWRRLCAAIAMLPPRCREVFVLYMRDGLTLGEIAVRLGISRNMAQKHMRLALERCWAALD